MQQLTEHQKLRLKLNLFINHLPLDTQTEKELLEKIDEYEEFLLNK